MCCRNGTCHILCRREGLRGVQLRLVISAFRLWLRPCQHVIDRRHRVGKSNFFLNVNVRHVHDALAINN
jgi:hypothetical protein